METKIKIPRVKKSRKKAAKQEEIIIPPQNNFIMNMPLSEYEKFQQYIGNAMNYLYKKYGKCVDYPSDISVEQLSQIVNPSDAEYANDNDDEEKKINYSMGIKESFNYSEMYKETLKAENCMLENIQISKLIFMESKANPAKMILKHPNTQVKIEVFDNSYIFIGLDQDKISTKSKFSSFFEDLQVIKLCKIESSDPELEMKAFVVSEIFSQFYKKMFMKYIDKNIVIEYKLSHEYYEEYQNLAKNSEKLAEKSKKKKKNIGFIKFYIYSKIPKNKEFILMAYDEIKNSITEIFKKTQFIFHKINLFNTIVDERTMREISEYANIQVLPITYNLVKLPDLNMSLLNGITTAIAIPNNIKYDRALDNQLKLLCYALNELFQNFANLGNKKNLMIFKHMMQLRVEEKAEISENHITEIDEFTVKFSKKTILYQEILEGLQQYELQNLSYTHEMKCFDFPKDLNEIRAEEIYIEMKNTINNYLSGEYGRNILDMLGESLKKFIKYGDFKVVFDENPITYNKDQFKFHISALYNRWENPLNIMLNFENKMKELFNDYKCACISLNNEITDSVKMGAETICSDFKNCCYFFIKSQKNSIFLISDLKTMLSFEEKLKSL